MRAFALQEALPTYMTMLNTLDGVRDETGARSSAGAVQGRGDEGAQAGL